MQNFPQIKSEYINQKKEGVKNLKYPNICPKQFCWSIVGQPGSGKTTFIEQMLNDDQFYKGKFDFIFIISQSPIKVKNVDKECITDQFNITWIYDRINYLNNLGLQNNNLLIIIDDCIAHIKQQQHNQLLIDLFFNRRHIWSNNTISLFLTTQQHTSMPLKFRQVCDCFTFLSLCPRDLDFIKKDLIPLQHRQLIQEHVLNLEEHQFLYIRVSPFLICLNFKPLISGSSYVSQSNNFQPVSKYRDIKPQLQDLLAEQQEKEGYSATVVQNNVQNKSLVNPNPFKFSFKKN